MSEPQPIVTVLIAAYRAEATISRAVRSALAQPEVAEVCVVDDASPDATADVARQADDGSGRLSVLVQTRNQGPSAARNRAIAATSAPWLCVLDSDDYLLPGRTARLLAASGEADLIADDLLQVPENADAPPAPDWPETIPRGVAIDMAEFISRNISRANVHRQELGYAKPLMRRAFLETHAITYREDMRLGEDYEFYARALAHGARMRLVPPAGYISVIRPGSLSAAHGETELQALRDCDADLALIRPLNARENRALRRHYSSVDSKLQWLRLIAAVKARDPAAIAAPFCRSAQVSGFLLARLAEQTWLRAPGLFRRR